MADNQLTNLGIEQLHQDQQKLYKQQAIITDVLEALNNKDLKPLLQDVLKQALGETLKIKADALPPVTIDGDVKAVVDGGSVTILNFAELEAYFIGLQLAMVEAIASPTPTNIVNDAPIAVSLEQIDEMLALLKQVADKDLSVTVDQSGGVGSVVFPKTASQAIPVRLVTADGKSFYNAFAQGGGGGSSYGTPTASTSETTTSTASTTSKELMPVNKNRIGGTVYNNSTANLYLKLGTGASATSFTVKLLQDDYYELPANYGGVVHGAWATNTGNAQVTEF